MTTLQLLYLFAGIGLLLSSYALYVEHKANSQKNYKAVCDIHNRVSCTKAFTSKYGKIFGVSNALFGLFYYVLVLILGGMGYYQILLWLSLCGCLASFYFAYLLFFKVKDFCVVCISIYIMNFLILFCAYYLVY